MRRGIGRIAIEGKFGQGKRRFGLSRIMAKLAAASETLIMLTFMVMNLEKMPAKALYFCLHLHFRRLNLLMKKVFQHIGQKMPLVSLRPT